MRLTERNCDAAPDPALDAGVASRSAVSVSRPCRILGVSTIRVRPRHTRRFRPAGGGMRYYGYRYLSTGLGRWSTRDPHDSNETQTLCRALENNSVDNIDILGKLSVWTVTEPHRVGNCGGFNWITRWELSWYETDGYIIQEVKTDRTLYSCDGPKHRLERRTYYEAWPVKGGFATDRNGMPSRGDIFSERDEPRTLGFSIKKTGAAMFWSGDLPPEFRYRPSECEEAGNLLCSFSRPSFWATGQMVGHWIKTSGWQCCCEPKERSALDWGIN
jgi:hypothetical protein